jgi:hypothetical protein
MDIVIDIGISILFDTLMMVASTTETFRLLAIRHKMHVNLDAFVSLLYIIV